MSELRLIVSRGVEKKVVCFVSNMYLCKLFEKLKKTY